MRVRRLIIALLMLAAVLAQSAVGVADSNEAHRIPTYEDHFKRFKKNCIRGDIDLVDVMNEVLDLSGEAALDQFDAEDFIDQRYQSLKDAGAQYLSDLDLASGMNYIASGLVQGQIEDSLIMTLYCYEMVVDFLPALKMYRDEVGETLPGADFAHNIVLIAMGQDPLLEERSWLERFLSGLRGFRCVTIESELMTKYLRNEITWEDYRQAMLEKKCEPMP